MSIDHAAGAATLTELVNRPRTKSWLIAEVFGLERPLEVDVTITWGRCGSETYGVNPFSKDGLYSGWVLTMRDPESSVRLLLGSTMTAAREHIKYLALCGRRLG